MNLTELRQKYPDYNDMSDQEFADAFHGKFYSDIPKEEFYGKIGYAKEAPKKSFHALDNPIAGVGETALSMLTGAVAMPVAGISGLLSGGDAEKVRSTQEALTYAPRGKQGQDYTGAVSDLFALPVKYAGKGADALGMGDLGYALSTAGTEAAMNFLPLGAAAKGAKGLLKGKGKATPTPRTITAIEADLTPSESIPKPPETIYTDSNGVSRSAPPDAGELAARAAQAKAAEAAGPSPFELDARRWAESNAADEATVARLEATLAKRNQPQPTMNIDSEGALRTPEELQAANNADAQAAASQRQMSAQQAIEARQAQMEYEVKRQTALEQQAAMRARQESAPTGYGDYVANRNVEDATRSAEQLQRLNEQLPEGGYKAQQSIVEDFGNNDPMERMPNMRVDENGMPIRADLSMELQNLENPLQRNMWGDELGPALDQTHSLTDAIDSMPPGKARDAAIRMLSGTGTPKRVVPRGQRGAIDASVFEDMFNFGRSVIRGANGKLLPLYHGSEAEFHNIKASKEGGALGNGVYLAVRPEYASSYAEGNGGNVHQVYVNISKPLVIKGPGDPMVNALVSLGKTREQATAIVEKAYDHPVVGVEQPLLFPCRTSPGWLSQYHYGQ